MAYTTADIDAIIAQLEGALGTGYAEVIHENRRMIFKTTGDILKAIGYFKGLRNNATDAPAGVDTRTLFFYGGNR